MSETSGLKKVLDRVDPKREPMPELTEEEKTYREGTVPVDDGWNVFTWPEFVSFRKRLGIPYHLDETAITIRIALDERPKIVHEYGPREPKKSPIDTTTQHNEKFRTSAPGANADAGNPELRTA